MSDNETGTKGISVKFPVEKRKDDVYLTADEFDALFKLSGETNRSRFVHLALRHYIAVVRDQLATEHSSLETRITDMDTLFPADKD